MYMQHSLKHRLCIRSRFVHKASQISFKKENVTTVLSEKTFDDINKALAEIESKDKIAPSPLVGLYQFFEQTKSIAKVVELLRKGPWDEEIKADLKNLHVKFSPPLVTQVLRADIQCDVALSFFCWLKSVGRFRHNEYTYGAILNALGRAGRLREMQGLFDEMKSGACLVTPVTLSNVMLWYFKAKDVTSVVEHWRMMRQSGARLSAAIYAAYIDFALSAKQYKRVAVVFEEMLNNGSLPNSRIYAIFIQHLVDNGKLDAATKILELMQTMHLVPCRVTYKTLVNEYARNGDLDKAQALLVEMKEHFHKPTKQLMPVVRALQAAGKIEEATALLEEITAVSQLNFDDKIYSSDEEYVSDSECTLSEWRAISCLHPGFDVNAFAQVLHPWEPRMIEVLAQADVQWEHYLVMGIFKRLKNIDSIWPFFHWLKDNAGFKHDNYTCGALIHRIFKSKLNLERKAFLVKELFEGLRHENIKFTVPIFNTVMRYFVAAGEGDKALSMFSLMKDLGIEPNNISYSLAVEGCAKNHQLKRVTELLQEVQLKSFHLTSTACAQYITCLASLGKINDAYNFFCHMRTLEKGCSSVEYKAIISAFDRARDHAMAFQMYEEMRAAGIEPTQDMYELIIRVLQQANRLTEVNVMAEERRLLSFFGGNKKEMQEKLLQVLFLLIKSLKPKKSEKCVPNAVI